MATFSLVRVILSGGHDGGEFVQVVQVACHFLGALDESHEVVDGRRALSFTEVNSGKRWMLTSSDGNLSTWGMGPDLQAIRPQRRFWQG